MRYGILADIHSNLAAFTAVMEDISRRGKIDGLIFLGDIVGYGPQPRECIELLRKYQVTAICGNHDRGATRDIDISDFND